MQIIKHFFGLNNIKLSIRYFLFLVSAMISFTNFAQKPIALANHDSLAGSNHAGRNWWDVQHYTLDVEPDIQQETIKGKVSIIYKITGKGSVLMLDLQEPLKITSLKSGGKDVKYSKKDRFYWVDKNDGGKTGSLDSLEITYEGKPRKAANAPWDGGLVWAKDEKGRPYVGTACQGIGASIWWPCKDQQYDEPDKGVDIFITADKELTAASNGKLINVRETGQKKKWHWRVSNPINNYDVTMNIAYYSHIKDQYKGVNGSLDVEFYTLDYNLEKGKKLFPEILTMLSCFENRVGPYPFYEDGFKMIETSFLGMEHQSGIAYGNKYLRGYLGSDRSKSGFGLLWDFILVHESGHEWYGNSITARDVNDNWIHEGFTTYLETIYTECVSGKEAAQKYVIGQRKIISNKEPLIGKYGVNHDATGDIYDKGSNLIHTIRTIIDDDEKFFNMIREMNKKFYHTVVTSGEIEQFMINKSGLDLKTVFDQYLRKTNIPVLEYSTENGVMTVKWTKVVDNFKMSMLAIMKDGSRKWIKVTDQPVSLRLKGEFDRWDENIYCEVKKI